MKWRRGIILAGINFVIAASAQSPRVEGIAINGANGEPIAGASIPLNVFMEFVVPALAVPFLILFKYGRPRGYLTDLVRSYFAPKAWCALERDTELTNAYVVDEEE